MTERSRLLKEHIDQQRAMGARRSMCFALAEKSLELTVGEDEALRISKARAYVLDHAPLVLMPQELISGSALGICPVGDANDTVPFAHGPLPLRLEALDIGLRGIELMVSPEERLFVQAQQRFILRYANALSGAANRAQSPRREELQHMALALRHLSTERADTFYEGLQLLWMLLVMGFILDEREQGLGRLDQILGARYESDLSEGRMDEADGAELLRCVFLKLSEPVPGLFGRIVLGGLTQDGTDGANALTSLCLKTLKEQGMPALQVILHIGALSPLWLLREALPLVATRTQLDVWNEDRPQALDPGKNAFRLRLKDAERAVREQGRAGKLALETFDQFFEMVKTEVRRRVPVDDTPLYAEGLFEAANRLMAIKCGVYDSKHLRLWQGDFEARLEALLGETPCVGEDNDEVDAIALGLLNAYSEAAGKKRTVALSGERLPSWVAPTAALNSLLKLDCSKLTGGCFFELPLDADMLENEKGMEAIRALVAAYLKGGGPMLSLTAIRSEIGK